MLTVDITPEQCEHIQQKLRQILLRSPDADISLLLEQLEISSRTPSQVTQVDSVTQPASSNGLASYNSLRSKKRVMPDTEDASGESEIPRKITKPNDARNTRNDGRRRDQRNTHIEGNDGRSIATVDHGLPATIPIAQPLIRPVINSYGFEDDSELSSLSSCESNAASPPTESDTESEAETVAKDVLTLKGSAPMNPKPQRRAKARGRKLNSWEMVEDVREITEPAAKLLQALAGIGDEVMMSRLLALKDKLSSPMPEPTEPATITLPLLVKRTRNSEAKMVEHKFKHMVDLMQLSIWLNQ